VLCALKWDASADFTYSNIGQTTLAAQAPFNYLVAYLDLHPEERRHSTSAWSDIAGEVETFAGLKSRAAKRQWFEARGVYMPEAYWNDVTPTEEDLQAMGIVRWVKNGAKLKALEVLAGAIKEIE
jgi:hypothetical protein